MNKLSKKTKKSDIIRGIRTPRLTVWEEMDKEVFLCIRTKLPGKWTMIDRETGQSWRWNGSIENPGWMAG